MLRIMYLRKVILYKTRQFLDKKGLLTLLFLHISLFNILYGSLGYYMLDALYTPYFSTHFKKNINIFPFSGINPTTFYYLFFFPRDNLIFNSIGIIMYKIYTGSGLLTHVINLYCIFTHS